MKNIGIMGGLTTYRLGNQNDVKLFFNVLKQLPQVMMDSEVKYFYFERLYTKYIEEQDLSRLLEKNEELRSIFSSLTVEDINLDILVTNNITLDLFKGNLANVFIRFFKGIETVAWSAKDVKEDWDKYFPANRGHPNLFPFSLVTVVLNSYMQIRLSSSTIMLKFYQRKNNESINR